MLSPFRVLPTEILDHILSNVPKNVLATSVLVVSRSLHMIALRILYHTISHQSTQSTVLLLRTLSKRPTLASIVRTLEIGFAEVTPTPNLYRLIHAALKQTTHLTSLSLDLPSRSAASSFAWILKDCPFALEELVTSIRCDEAFARVLESQPSLVELCIRGFESSPALSLFPHLPRPPRIPFTLASSALPNLRYFRAINASPEVLAHIVEGRPVEGVSIPFSITHATASLDALALSSRPIKRLTIMSFDSVTPDWLLPEVAQRMGKELEALHVVILRAQYGMNRLRDSSPQLSAFKSLKYLTFIAAGIQDSSPTVATPATLPPLPVPIPPPVIPGFASSDRALKLAVASLCTHSTSSSSASSSAPQSPPRPSPPRYCDPGLAEEQLIATLWHNACPTLKTIILPRGKVWFDRGSEEGSEAGWRCLGED